MNRKQELYSSSCFDLIIQKRFFSYWTLSLVLILFFFTDELVGEEITRYFKSISTLEYKGDESGQFRNQIEFNYRVAEEIISKGKIRYKFSRPDPNKPISDESGLPMFSFVIDTKTRRISDTPKAENDIFLFAEVNNKSIKSIKKVTQDYIGKTWGQSIDLSSISEARVKKIGFTLTAIRVKTRIFGEMVAVRALSLPFFAKIGEGTLKSKINTVYLFGPKIEDVYLSISVFEGTTNVQGYKETFRHESATYRTDANGRPLDLSDVGRDFEALVATVGLRKDSLQIVKQSGLPPWVRPIGVRVAQVAIICSGAVCEGGSNPVVKLSLPMVMGLKCQKEYIRNNSSSIE